MCKNGCSFAQSSNFFKMKKHTTLRFHIHERSFPMSNVRRVYVEKKPSFAVKAKELKHEISSYLGIQTVTNVRELIRYDVENISDDVFEKAKNNQNQ